ncbi:MAG TPA: chorismate mutase [Dehalococcoidia bacterium]|jgi:chorismate mutase|nr:chorismate mutase [Dehalococcoidia bacterium]
MTVCIGIRGATQADSNVAEDIYGSTKELLQQLILENTIEESQVAAVFFTATDDLNAAYPAAAARQLGWNDTALMCSTEIPVPGYPPRCIRILILVNTEKTSAQIKNVYLKETFLLRQKGLGES